MQGMYFSDSKKKKKEKRKHFFQRACIFSLSPVLMRK